MMMTFYTEIIEQPASLRKLIHYYQQQFPSLLSSIPAPSDLILTGMGASLHASEVATYHLQSMGRRALAIEAVDLIRYGSAFLDGRYELLYISQSGQSAEVLPLLALAKSRKIFMAVTNDLNSPLANGAEYVLPLAVETEKLVATQTYANTLAVLWLLIRRWTGISQIGDFETILQLADFMEEILANSEAITSHWLEQLRVVDLVVFTGFGVHSATARQSAQTVAEYAKVPVLGLSAGALKHGFIEMFGPNIGLVVFMAHDCNWEPACRLEREMQSYGVKTLIVQHGHSRPAQERMEAGVAFDEFLSPILDVIPVQLFAEALAAELGVPPGFRYLHKVVSYL
jgi:glucosamine--fructose-6-phosphate aminotransferase (isomerizing)